MSKFSLPFSTNDTALNKATPGFGEMLITQSGEVRFGDGHTPGGVSLSGNTLWAVQYDGTRVKVQ